MEIKVNIEDGTEELQEYRSHKLAIDWLDLIEGDWGEDTYHSGFLEYSVAKTKEDVWLLNSCARYECLDDLTQEDIDQECFLNDDQAQAIFDHGSLEAAQKVRYNRIVAAGFGFPSDIDWELIGNKMYKAVIEAGGKEIIHMDLDDY